MATKAAIPQHGKVPHGKGQKIGPELKKKKNFGAGKLNRRALGDIGNSLVTIKGPDVKLLPRNRPNTRSFHAQLQADAKVNAAELNNETKSFYEVAPGIPKVGPTGKNKKKAPPVKPKPEKPIIIDLDTEEEPLEIQADYLNLTAVLAARSRAAAEKKPTPLIEDIDAGDENNELAVVEYLEDIYKYYFDAEEEHRIEDYMSRQSSINEKIRAVVVDWLIDAHSKFNLAKPTLYLTINLVDRFLCTMVVSRSDLQLVGLGAMLLATKYEEIWGPSVKDLVSVADFGCTNKKILRMEKVILRKLDWSLTFPTQYMFLVRFIKACLSDQELESMVYFFAELGMMYYATTQQAPSKMAASAVYAARLTLEKVPVWNDTLKKHTHFEETELMESAKLLVGYHCLAFEENSRLNVVFRKYSRSVQHRVALRPPAKSLLAASDH